MREGLASGRIAGLGLDVQEQEPVDPQDWLAQHPRWVLAAPQGSWPRPYCTPVCAALGAGARACVCLVDVFAVCLPACLPACSVYLTPHIAGVTEMSCERLAAAGVSLAPPPCCAAGPPCMAARFPQQLRVFSRQLGKP